MIIEPPMCFKCRHFKNEPKEHWFKCTAYPDGIPNEIFYGRHDHRKKFANDRGIRFEPRHNKDIESLDNRLDKSAEVLNSRKESFEAVIKHWDQWSRFRKPKYDPSNRKSVSACRKYARFGIVKPGCGRAMDMAENIYEKGKDDTEYVPPDVEDPSKLFSRIKEEREKEQQKQKAIGTMDKAFDDATFYRAPNGLITILNWSSLPPEDKKLLSSLFDESGRMKEDKIKEFDKRFNDYNTRRTKRGLDQKKIM